MELDNEKITPQQFMFSVACLIQASALLSSFLSPVANHDSWLAIVLGMLASVPFLLVYVSLMKVFPKKNIIQLNDIVFGPVLGKVISICYIWFFLTLTSLNLLDLGSFVKLTIMNDTPVIYIVVLCMLICALAIRSGLSVVTRYSFLFSMISVGVLVFSVLTTLNQMHLTNFMPVLDQQPVRYIQSVNIIMTIPFGEVTVFGMIYPHVKWNKRGIGAYAIPGFLLGGMVMLGVVAHDTSVLGNIAPMFALPSFETLRMVSLTQSLGRMEILFAVVLIVMLFFKICILYYVSVSALAQILNMKSYHPIILSVGACIVAYSFFLYPSSAQHAASGQQVTPILWIFFEFLVPVIALLVTWLRKLPARAAREGTMQL